MPLGELIGLVSIEVVINVRNANYASMTAAWNGRHIFILILTLSPKNSGCNESPTYTSSLQNVPSVLVQLRVTEVSSLVVIPIYLITYST